MLQIKKILNLSACHYNLAFLFKLKSFSKKFILKKKTSSFITLRSPKHFNIGKNKIISVNSKLINYKINFNKKVRYQALFQEKLLWKILSKYIKKNTHTQPISMLLVFKAKFKLMWLGF